MEVGDTPARSSAPRDATAPSSIALTLARAPPFRPSPRLPPTHSAMGVRAPERITTSGSPLVDKGLLLVAQVVDEVGVVPGMRVAAGAGGCGVTSLRCATLAPVA